MLVRTFVRPNGHHQNRDFRGTNFPTPEIQVYAWLDTSIDDVMELLRSKHSAAARANAPKLSIARVTFDTETSRFKLVNMCIVAADGSAPQSKSLRQFGFGVGDFLDVAILD